MAEPVPQPQSGEAINPYAASQIPEARSDAAPSERPSAARSYDCRLTWLDRRNFLRSVGPERLIAVLLAVQCAKSVFDTVSAWAYYFSHPELLVPLNIVLLLLAVGSVVQGILSAYICWLTWQSADLMRDFAGGSSTNMQPWSSLYIRITRVAALAAVIAVSVEMGRWLAIRWLVP